MRAIKAAETVIRGGLDRTEALGVGDGKLDLGILGDWNSQDKAATVGGYADYTHRLSESISAFARAEGGAVLGAGGPAAFARAGAGIRFRF